MFAIIAPLITSLASFFGLNLAKKTAYAAAAISVSVALTLALASGLQNLISELSASFPDYLSLAWMFLPENMSACVSACTSATIIRFIYDWNMSNLKTVSSIN